jgi:uncharacterized protein (TIGR02594 family)
MTTMLETAYGEMGQREIAGPKNNPRIMEYFAACGAKWVKNETTPWCGSFIGWCANENGLPMPDEPLRARAWLDWGQECQPQPGAVTVLRRGKNPTEGHVGLFVRQEGDKVFLLGGNQGDAVTISAFPADAVLGYRWPEGESRGQAMRDAVGQLPQFNLARLYSRVSTTLGLGGGTAAWAISGTDVALIVIGCGLVGFIAFECFKAGILTDYRKGNIVGGKNA